MGWLAIIVITTNIGGVQYMERIPAATQADCEMAVTHYVDGYSAAPAKYYYECVDIGSIVRGGK